jgi:hypothetical protein
VRSRAIEARAPRFSWWMWMVISAAWLTAIVLIALWTVA